MKTDKQNELFKKYPNIFKQKDLSPQQTAMCWGIACGDGWFSIIDSLCFNIKSHIEAKNKKLEEENSLSGIKELNKNHIDLLIKNNINNKEDLADLSVDELLEMIELSKEDAGKIIMDAREPWFNQD